MVPRPVSRGRRHTAGQPLASGLEAEPRDARLDDALRPRVVRDGAQDAPEPEGSGGDPRPRSGAPPVARRPVTYRGSFGRQSETRRSSAAWAAVSATRLARVSG